MQHQNYLAGFVNALLFWGETLGILMKTYSQLLFCCGGGTVESLVYLKEFLSEVFWEPS